MDHRVEKKGSLGHLLLKLIKMEEAHWSVCVLPIAQGWRKGQIKTVLLRPAEYVLENVLEWSVECLDRIANLSDNGSDINR